jgi:hypothetical protein
MLTPFEKLKFTVDELHAQPVVAPHHRRHSNPDFRVQGSAVVCPANLEMFCRGKMTPRRTGISYIQFSCPIHYDHCLQQRFLVCPAAHPKFFQQERMDLIWLFIASLNGICYTGEVRELEVSSGRVGIDEATVVAVAFAAKDPYGRREEVRHHTGDQTSAFLSHHFGRQGHRAVVGTDHLSSADNAMLASDLVSGAVDPGPQ